MLMRDHIHHAPQIVTQLPGPKAAKLIELDERYTSPSYTRVYPLAVAKGEGAVIEDVDGTVSWISSRDRGLFDRTLPSASGQGGPGTSVATDSHVGNRLLLRSTGRTGS